MAAVCIVNECASHARNGDMACEVNKRAGFGFSDYTTNSRVDCESTPATPAANAIAYTQTTCSTGVMPTPQSSAANAMDKPYSPIWQPFTPTQPQKPGNKN